jgi:hypothetical protein
MSIDKELLDQLMEGRSSGQCLPATNPTAHAL